MVFIKKGSGPHVEDLTISELTGRRLRKGEVGIEVEVEGRNIPREGPHPWLYHADGSLRGADNGEFVLANPVAFGEVPAKVDELFKFFKDNKTVLDQSIRTSVHVHLNVGPFYMNRLTALMALYVTFEEVLTAWCGEHRVGNLFCLRAKDAPNIITTCRQYIASRGMTGIRENHHYAGMNANAIFKFGSLEFRPLRGVTDPETLKLWVEILQKIYEASDKYKDPRELIESFSMQGPLEFFYETLGEHGTRVMDDLRWDADTVRSSLYEGIRMAQDLCYARDWSDFKPVKRVADPFGRKTAKAAGRRDPEVQEDAFTIHVRNMEAIARMERANRGQAVPANPFPPIRPARVRPAPQPPQNIDWGPEELEIR